MADLRQNLNGLVMTVYMDGTYRIQSELDSHYESECVVDYLTSIPLPLLEAEINKVRKS